MNKFFSSKIFIAIIAFIVGGLVGWFLWYVVYPNLHVSGSKVWTGTSSKINPSSHNSGYYSSGTKNSSGSSTPSYTVPSSNNSSSGSNSSYY